MADDLRGVIFLLADRHAGDQYRSGLRSDYLLEDARALLPCPRSTTDLDLLSTFRCSAVCILVEAGLPQVGSIVSWLLTVS